MSAGLDHVKAVNAVWSKFIRTERLFMSGYGQTIMDGGVAQAGSVGEAIHGCGFVAGAAMCSRQLVPFHSPRWWIARMVGMLADSMSATLRGEQFRTPSEITAVGEQFIREIFAELNKLDKAAA